MRRGAIRYHLFHRTTSSYGDFFMVQHCERIFRVHIKSPRCIGRFSYRDRSLKTYYDKL